MKKVKEKIFMFPIISSVIISLIAGAIVFISVPVMVTNQSEQQLVDYLTGIVEQTGAGLLLILLLKKLGIFEKSGFHRTIRELWIIWPAILFILFNASDVLSGKMKIDVTRPFLILAFVLVYLSTGFFEEILCRGVMFSLLLHKWGKTKGGCYLAMIVSGIMFGMLHFVHYFMGDASMLATVTQVIYAAMIGTFFAACVVRNKSIYPAILLHGIVDISGSFGEIAVGGGINKSYQTMTFPVAMILIIIALPLFLYGLFIVRKEFQNGMNQTPEGK